MSLAFARLFCHESNVQFPHIFLVRFCNLQKSLLKKPTSHILEIHNSKQENNMENKLTNSGAILISFQSSKGGVTLILPPNVNDYDQILTVIGELNQVVMKAKFIAENEEKSAAPDPQPEVEVLETEEVEVVEESEEEDSDPEDNK